MKIKKSSFYPVVILLTILLLNVCTNLETIKITITEIYNNLSSSADWIFIISAIISLLFSLWAIFSKYGKIKIGGKDAKPEFSNLSWIGMMFTTSISGGLILMSFIEQVLYVSAPPDGIIPFSYDAYKYSGVYIHHNWGLVIFVIYVPVCIAISYLFHNCGNKRLELSSSFDTIDKANKYPIIKKIIDIISIIVIIIAPVPGMGMVIPFITKALQNVIGFPNEMVDFVRIVILSIIVIIYATCAFLGLHSGIKKLGNLNIVVAILIMIMFGILAGPATVIRREIESLGLYAQNIIKLFTYTDSFGDRSFLHNWTVWDIAWSAIYIPLMGTFVAKVSKGRTIRDISIAIIGCISACCWFSFMTIGNYSINLQMCGKLDIANIYNSLGQTETVFEIVNTTPFPEFIGIVLSIVCILFTCTTLDSCAYTVAQLTSVNHEESDKKSMLLRLFWAIVSAIVAFILVKINEFSAIQTLALLAGFPMCIIAIILSIATVLFIVRNENKQKNITNNLK